MGRYERCRCIADHSVQEYAWLTVYAVEINVRFAGDECQKYYEKDRYHV